MALLLLIPYRAGESWAVYTLAAVGLLITVPTAYASYQVQRRTPGKPPVAVLAAEVVLVLAGLLFSLI